MALNSYSLVFPLTSHTSIQLLSCRFSSPKILNRVRPFCASFSSISDDSSSSSKTSFLLSKKARVSNDLVSNSSSTNINKRNKLPSNHYYTRCPYPSSRRSSRSNDAATISMVLMRKPSTSSVNKSSSISQPPTDPEVILSNSLFDSTSNGNSDFSQVALNDFPFLNSSSSTFQLSGLGDLSNLDNSSHLRKSEDRLFNLDSKSASNSFSNTSSSESSPFFSPESNKSAHGSSKSTNSRKTYLERLLSSDNRLLDRMKFIRSNFSESGSSSILGSLESSDGSNPSSEASSCINQPAKVETNEISSLAVSSDSSSSSSSSEMSSSANASSSNSSSPASNSSNSSSSSSDSNAPAPTLLSSSLPLYPKLFALPLYRKPAFPGFYQILQIQDQEVFDFLMTLKKTHGQNYVGGFFVRSEFLEQSGGLVEAEEDRDPTSCSSLFSTSSHQYTKSNQQQMSQSTLRRDAGRVNSLDDLHQTGTILHLLNISPHIHLKGGQVIVMPHKRIRRTKELSNAAKPSLEITNISETVIQQAEFPETVEKTAQIDQINTSNDEPNKSIENIKIDETLKANNENIKTDEILKANNENIKTDEILKTNNENIKTDETLKTNNENIKIDEILKTNNKNIKIDEILKTNNKNIKIDEILKTDEILKDDEAHDEEESVEGLKTKENKTNKQENDLITQVFQNKKTSHIHMKKQTNKPITVLPSVYVEYIQDDLTRFDANDTHKALHLEIISTMKDLLKTSFFYKEHFEQIIRFYNLDYPHKLIDLVCGMSLSKGEELQPILDELNVEKRLHLVLEITKKDLEFSKLQIQVKNQVEEKATKEQRRYILMEQLKFIKRELGLEKDDKTSIIQKFREKLYERMSGMTGDVRTVIEEEIGRFSTLDPANSEYNMSRTYLEWLTSLPWGVHTLDNQDIYTAENILNEDHFGLKDVKNRILELIAVNVLRQDTQGKIICLLGPPGVGKTSIGKSIARALNKKFFQFSLGGLSDVAELYGHRRTYVGSMPGKLIQALKHTESSNPLILLDEIDKLGRDMRGDPASALLEILDPSQNSSFRDHYLDVPVDLSKVLFVCTANTADTIPPALLDRLEVIRLAGYIFEEKIEIANNYLIPQTILSTGVHTPQIYIENDVLPKLISEYSREAGVRNLLKLIEKIYRKVALQIVKGDTPPIHISVNNLTKFVGQPYFHSERLYVHTPPGVVMGLAWTQMGGATLYVESTGFLSNIDNNKNDKDRQSGSFKVTGQLGSVMNESSQIAFTFSRSFIREIDINNKYLDKADIHLHVPEGATPKDGPSAGVTMASSLISLALAKKIKKNCAMTGELTLTGKVLKIGGVKEKVIAAKREGANLLIFPTANERDFMELDEPIRAGLEVHFAEDYNDVYKIAFEV